jgi:hypothetical protein
MKANSLDISMKATEKSIYNRLILEYKEINNYEYI